MNKYTIEKGEGVPLDPVNLFLEDIKDMEAIEYWEGRLDALGQKYITAFRELEGVVYYSIFVKSRIKRSAFK